MNYIRVIVLITSLSKISRVILQNFEFSLSVIREQRIIPECLIKKSLSIKVKLRICSQHN